MNLSSLMSISGPITSSRLAFRRIWDSLHTHNTRITLLEKANLQCYSESTILLISSSLSSLDSDSLTEVDTRHILIGASRVAASCCFIETPCVTAVFFLHFSSRERRFVSRIILFQTVRYAIVPKMQSWAHVIFLLTRGAARGSNGIARQPHGRARQPSRATK